LVIYGFRSAVVKFGRTGQTNGQTIPLIRPIKTAAQQASANDKDAIFPHKRTRAVNKSA